MAFLLGSYVLDILRSKLTASCNRSTFTGLLQRTLTKGPLQTSLQRKPPPPSKTATGADVADPAADITAEATDDERAIPWSLKGSVWQRTNIVDVQEREAKNSTPSQRVDDVELWCHGRRRRRCCSSQRRILFCVPPVKLM